jgi:hypothetical protein
MANFGPPKQVVQQQTSAKETSIRLVKAVVLEMSKRGKTIEQIKAFARNPGPESLGLKSDPYSSRDALFNQIKLNTTLEDRVKVLIELEETGQL